MFTTEHFIWLALCAAIIGILCYISFKFKFSFKTASSIMAIVALASEISKVLSHMSFVDSLDPARGMVIEAGALPFHLCSMFIFVFFYLPFAKNEKLKDYFLSLFVPVGLIGAFLAIIMATSGTDFNSIEPYQCFIFHSAMIWFAIYIIKTKQAKLGIRPWLTNIVSLFAVSIIMIWVNGALQCYDTNFLYVVRPPVKGLPILNLDNGWYTYFATLIACGFVGLSAVQLPFIIKEIKNKKKSPD